PEAHVRAVAVDGEAVRVGATGADGHARGRSDREVERVERGRRDDIGDAVPDHDVARVSDRGQRLHERRRAAGEVVNQRLVRVLEVVAVCGDERVAVDGDATRSEV